MLVAALVVTLVGFGLLVVALITSSVAFAWACVAVCLVGFGLLIADVLGLRKGDAESTTPPAAAEHDEVESPEDLEDEPAVTSAESDGFAQADVESPAHAAHGETEQGRE